MLLAEKRLPFKTRNFNAGSLLRLLNMLTADLYAMRFYCFDYYVEHFNMRSRGREISGPMQANAVSINSQRAKTLFCAGTLCKISSIFP